MNMVQGAAAPNATPTPAPANGAAAPLTVTANGIPAMGAPPPAGGDWTAGLSDELKGYVQNKGFKDPTAVVDSYRNFEKLWGVPKERILKLPEKDDDPAWGEIHERLGKPKEAKDYNIEIPPEMQGDARFAEWGRKTFHELGLSKKQGEVLASKWNDFMKGQVGDHTKSLQDKFASEDLALKGEWGQAYDQEVNVAGRAAKAFGISPDMIDKIESALGFAGTMKLFNSLGKKVGEDKFVSGDGSGGSFSGNVLTPQAATERMNSLKQDKEWVSKYLSGDANSRAEMERLLKMAHPQAG